jgi:predicted metal-dependent hydrolase
VEFLNRDVFVDWHQPLQISWVSNQNSRWGSCTPGTGIIRISDRIQPMPDYVIDCVILHELAHLFHLAHDDKFYAIANLHPKSGEAAAYLEGFSLGARLEMSFD